MRINTGILNQAIFKVFNSNDLFFLFPFTQQKVSKSCPDIIIMFFPHSKSVNEIIFRIVVMDARLLKITKIFIFLEKYLFNLQCLFHYFQSRLFDIIYLCQRGFQFAKYYWKSSLGTVLSSVCVFVFISSIVEKPCALSILMSVLLVWGTLQTIPLQLKNTVGRISYLNLLVTHFPWDDKPPFRCRNPRPTFHFML